MNLDNTRVKPTKSDDDNLIPLINVVFLMLIFFMVAGQIQPSDGIEVEPPASISKNKVTPERLKIVIAQDGQLVLDGHLISKDELGNQVSAYLNALTEEQKNNAAVVLKADGNLTVDLMQEYVNTIKASGIARISLMTNANLEVSS